uniref:ARAD1D10142p n=1 Tax=Blastobotrys adeninivorans TaxID=409370 RepID=A0A060T8T9_BLAAD
MRDSNFRSVPGNRASMSITTTLYDRRALDCTSDKPLVNSLNHLTYLLSTSARIRETVCVDGGLERLVDILKECRDDRRCRSTGSNAGLVAWKWTLALQCLVFLGTRGSEKVRRRVVEAGSIPVIATILDNHLQTLEQLKARQLALQGCSNNPADSCGLINKFSGNSATGTNGAPNGASANDHSNATSAANSATNSLASSAVLPSSASVLSVNTNTTASTSSLFDDAASIVSTTTTTSTTSSAILSGYASVSGMAAPDDRMPRSSSSNAASFAHNILHQATNGSTTPSAATSRGSNGSVVANPARELSHRIYSQASNAVYYAHAHAHGPASGGGDNDDGTTAAASSSGAGNAPEPRSVSPEQQLPLPGSGTEGGEAMIQEDVSMLGDAGAPQVTAETIMADNNANAEAAENNNTAANNNPMTANNANTNNTNNNPHSLGLLAAASSMSSPQSIGVPRYFQNHVIVPRDEDVIWALEILAFVSKYAYLKSHLQELHLVPQLSIRDPNLPPLKKAAALHGGCADGCEDHCGEHSDGTGCHDYDFQDGNLRMVVDDCSTDSSSKEYDDDDEYDDDNDKWNYDTYDFESEQDIDDEYLGELFNIFPLVEKFTIKTFPKEIQYWAGVIMRNSCRKDETRGGIRQCASFECGKWEEYPRQFAKCRRCKRTKYCSKACQLKAWNLHRFWCVPSNGPSTSGSSSSRSHSHRHEESEAANAAASASTAGAATTPVRNDALAVEAVANGAV